MRKYGEAINQVKLKSIQKKFCCFQTIVVASGIATTTRRSARKSGWANVVTGDEFKKRHATSTATSEGAWARTRASTILTDRISNWDNLSAPADACTAWADRTMLTMWWVMELFSGRRWTTGSVQWSSIYGMMTSVQFFLNTTAYHWGRYSYGGFRYSWHS